MIITVNCQRKSISWQEHSYPCRIGKNGYIDQGQGKEGDAKTPLGEYRLRFGFYRSDRLPGEPPSRLNFWPIEPNDGWCDDINSPAYNRFVRLPLKETHEKLWREDGAYDIILVVDHNDNPPEKGRGSAIFIHIAQSDDRETLGCVALGPEIMIKLLKYIGPDTKIQIIE